MGVRPPEEHSFALLGLPILSNVYTALSMRIFPSNLGDPAATASVEGSKEWSVRNKRYCAFHAICAIRAIRAFRAFRAIRAVRATGCPRDKFPWSVDSRARAQ